MFVHNMLFDTLFNTCLIISYLVQTDVKGLKGLRKSAIEQSSSSPGVGHCVVFLGKTLDTHNASLHSSVQTGTGKVVLRQPDAMLESNLRRTRKRR